MSSQPDNTSDLLLYLRLLAARPQPTQFFDIRNAAAGGGMQQRFVAVRRINQAARWITRLGAMSDVYIGVALRDRAHGDKSAITGSRLLYIESDTPNTSQNLERFACPPTMQIASGTDNHQHLYWLLHERAPNLQVEAANRRLALALDGDQASVDIARILRPPSTLNHKHDPPRPVMLLSYNPHHRYTLAQITHTLPNDPKPPNTHPQASPARRAPRSDLDRQLLSIPAAEYARVLAGRTPNNTGKILCPFHDEKTPSLKLYPDGTFYCFGRLPDRRPCGKGGTIFDFAAALWHTSTRNQDFLELRKRLADTFALTPTQHI